MKYLLFTTLLFCAIGASAQSEGFITVPSPISGVGNTILESDAQGLVLEQPEMLDSVSIDLTEYQKARLAAYRQAATELTQSYTQQLAAINVAYSEAVMLIADARSIDASKWRVDLQPDRIIFKKPVKQ